MAANLPARYDGGGATGTKPTAPAAALAVMARRGRSFRLAGRLLPRAALADAAALYGFCRSVDDLADDPGDPTAIRDSLAALAAALGGVGSHPLAMAFAPLRRRGVPETAAAALVATVRGDCGPVRISDEAGLLRYAYGVAGTVGIMMCAVLDVRDAEALPFAIDLGIAMQLTNIARDVAEDAARDRIYLPAAWLPPDYGPDAIARSPEPAFAAIGRVLVLAGRHYRSAEGGFRHLPASARTAVRAAASLYEAIGPVVLRAGPAALATGRRAVVPDWRRLLLLARCLAPAPPAAPHDALLHTALRGLPGASV